MSGHQQSDSDQTKLSQQSAADTRSDVPTSVEPRCSKIRRFWRRAFAGTTSLAFLISIARSRKFVLQSQHLLMIHFYERSNLLKINVPYRSNDHGDKGMNCLLRNQIGKASGRKRE